MTSYNKHYKFGIFFLFLVIQMFSCRNSDGGTYNDADTVMKKIVAKDTTFDEYISGVEKSVKNEIERKLAIGSLDGHSGGLHIRLYRFTPFDNDDRLIIIDSSSNWSAKLVNFSIKLNPPRDSLMSVIHKVVTKQPHSGWKTLIDSLVSFDIFTLPDCETIPGYEIPTDGGVVEVEFANEKKYRSYEYYAPDSNVGEIPEAKKILQILNFLRREFDFDGFGF